MTMRHGGPRPIAFLLIDGFALLSAAAAIEPLRAANRLAGAPLYRMIFLSRAGGWVESSSGGGFMTARYDALPDPCGQLFIVAGGDPLCVDDPALFGFLRRLHACGIALGGISGGAAILARAGVMRDRRFTVHWEHFAALRALSDTFLLERRLYVLDRDRATCAGGAAALDMMHALISAEHGAALARQVSDWFIHTHIRVSDNPQRAGFAERYGIDHPQLIAAVGLMDSHVADPLSLSQMAALLGMGGRHLNRLFRAHAGRPAMRFYRDLRLRKADELVRGSALQIVDIAIATGFSSAAHFTRAYSAEFGHPPRAVRAMARMGDRHAS